MKFPPINLWSKPYQKEYDELKDNVYYYSLQERIIASMVKQNEKKLKDLEFLYYTRSGRFPE